VVTHGAYGPPGSELQRLYEADAVDRYIGQLHAHIEDLQSQLADAMRIAHEAGQRAAEVGDAEAALGRAMLTAQRSADAMIADAERRAELILADARLEADRLLGDVRADAQRIVDEAHETVEAVFAALTSAREEQSAAPAPLPAVPPPPPEAFAPVGFAPVPPMPSWPAPDPAQRHVDDDEADRPPEVAEPAVSASAPDDESEDDGLIVDIRPIRGGHPGPQARYATPAGNGQGGGGWTASLGGTGTEGVPTLESELAPTWAAAPETVPSRPGGDLLDRWRLARGGPATFDDEFVSRQADMDSLADGSWMAQLRGDDTATASGGPTRQPWQPKPPPVGPPLDPPGRRSGLLGRRVR